ncbi:MAG: membrane protein insertase YidC [Bacteroidales bacterium]|nr:MAG: membrane protein insertase YidC [Bacteroidales bacterium]
MDRNTIIGIVLIFGILILFGYLNTPSKEKVAAMQHQADSIARANAAAALQQQSVEAVVKNVQADSVQKQEQVKQMGSFAESLKGEEKLITLENDLLKVKVSNRGGRVYSVEVKNYKTYAGQPLVLFNGDESTFGLQFWGNNNDIQTNDLFFTPSRTDSVILAGKNGEPQKLTMRLNAGVDSYIDYIYTITPGSYLLGFDIHFSGMNSIMNGRTGAIDLNWTSMMPQLEKGAKNESNYTTISYCYPNNEYEEISAMSVDDKKDITTKVKWIAFKHQFFSSILVAKDGFTNANLIVSKSNDIQSLKNFSARISLPLQDGEDETIGMNFFFGPNQFKILKSYNLGFEQNIFLGKWIIKWVNRYLVIPVFDILGSKLTSYGLIIFLLTLLLKLILLPLTYKSYLSSGKMRVLKPQIDEINAKHPNKADAIKKQQSIMALYRKVGVNPLGGCIPILIQFPFLIAMFRFFPASFELRQQSFLWADDLSSFDAIINLPFEIPMYGAHISLFTLLMAGALFVTSKMNADQMGDTNAQLPGMKFMMIYLMPLMMVVWFNQYAAGLSYYYFLANMFTLGQTLLIRRFVDDEAILAKLHENAKKPVKKSKFQEKLEQIAKQQEIQKGKRK